MSDFDELNPSDYVNKSLYRLDLDSESSKDDILGFINAHYKQLMQSPRDLNRLCNQNEDLAFYSGYACPLGNKNALIVTETGATNLNRRKKFTKIALNHLKDIVDNLVSRSIVRKPNYTVYPKNEFLMNEKGKARTAKKFLASKSQETDFVSVHTQHIFHTYMFGESYLEVFWNPYKGPLLVDDKKLRDKVPLLDSDGKPTKNKDGKVIQLDSRQKIGDVDIRLIDPRRIITPKENCFEDCEWVIIYENISVDKLRQRYPDQAADISPHKDLEIFDSGCMEYVKDPNSTLLFKLYHRATPEMPKGRVILTTPTAILLNDEYPHETVIDQDLFPVIQLRLEDLPDTERGGKSIISMGKHLQLAINNLINTQVRNVALFPPIRVWEEGSVDKDKLRLGSPTDITYRKNRAPPKVLTTESVSQPTILLINMLTERLMQLSNVLPISRGETIPNTESRLMLDFFKDQELAQSLPMDEKVKISLISIAKLWIAIAADEYKDSEKKKRMIKYFGERNSLVQSDLNIKDLKIPFDINIEILNTFADTFQGKVQQITQLLQIVPNALTPAKILDILELGNPDELLDSATAAVDLAEKEINELLEGKEVPPPQRYVDLVPYYEQYFRALQKSEIRSILPDLYDPSRDSELLKGNEQIAQRLLDQVAAIELMISEAIENMEAQGILNEIGKSPLRLEVMTRFPTFPTVLKTDSVETVDPFDIEDNVIPNQPSQQLPLEGPVLDNEGTPPGNPIT